MIFLLASMAAAAQPMLVPTFGAGTLKCEEAFGSERQTQAESWVLGFWTALNMESGKNVAPTSSAEGVLNSVKANCAKMPGATLLRATQLSYRGNR